MIDGIKTMDTDQWCSSTNQCFFFSMPKWWRLLPWLKQLFNHLYIYIGNNYKSSCVLITMIYHDYLLWCYNKSPINHHVSSSLPLIRQMLICRFLSQSIINPPLVVIRATFHPRITIHHQIFFGSVKSLFLLLKSYHIT